MQEGLNVPKRKAPNTPHFMNEYEYNNGYYFAECERDNGNIKICVYLKFGCTGCAHYDASYELSEIIQIYEKNNKST